MNKQNFINYKDQLYFDDRMFVLYLCKCSVKNTADDNVEVTIYHENIPENYVHCIATYRNCIGYPLTRVDCFHNVEDAISYLQHVEPQTPLISLEGNSPVNPPEYEEYYSWKKSKNLKEYDYKPLFTSGGSNPMELVFMTKKQFGSIR